MKSISKLVSRSLEVSIQMQIKSNQSKEISSKSKFEWHQLINLNNSNQIASNTIKMNQIKLYQNKSNCAKKVQDQIKTKRIKSNHIR